MWNKETRHDRDTLSSGFCCAILWITFLHFSMLHPGLRPENNVLLPPVKSQSSQYCSPVR